MSSSKTSKTLAKVITKPVPRNSDSPKSAISSENILKENYERPVDSEVSASNPRNEFDTLADVYHQDEPVDEGKLTSQERGIHEANLRRIKKIEEDAAAAGRRFKPGVEKTWNELTPEEKKVFKMNQPNKKEEQQNATE